MSIYIYVYIYVYIYINEYICTSCEINMTKSEDKSI